MTQLRPQFTQTLLATLKNRSVNIYGAAGQGQSRLLDDLQTAAQAQDLLVLNVDMKTWADNYAGFIAELHRQLRQLFPDITGQSKDFDKITNLLNKHAATTPVLLILNRFDALLDNAVHLDSKYTAFFPHLNSFRNQQHRRLLAVTTKPYNQYRFYIEKIHNTSPLDLKVCELAALTYEEIQQELRRSLTPLTDSDLGLLTRSIHQHPQAFGFLEFCVEQIQSSPSNQLDLEKRLKIWQKKFKCNHKKTLRRRLDNLINWLTIVGKEINALSIKIKFFIAAIIGLMMAFSGLKTLFNKIKTWLGY